MLRGDPVVEQVDDLVGRPGGGLGAEGQKRRVAEGAVAATDRLAARVTDILRECPAPVRGDHVELPLLGAELAQQIELGDRLADPRDRPRLLTQRLDWRRGRTRRDGEQLVERRRQAGREDRLDATVDLLLAVVACRRDEPLEHRQAGTDHAFASQAVDGVAHQGQRAVVTQRAVANRRSQHVEVLVAARPEGADRHRVREMLGARAALDVQPCRRDRGQVDVKLGCDQRCGRDGKLIQRGGHEPQPAQRTDRRRDREATMHAAMRRDRLELVVGEAKERRQRALVDLFREALPFCALSRSEDLDGHQNSISRSATAF